MREFSVITSMDEAIRLGFSDLTETDEYKPRFGSRYLTAEDVIDRTTEEGCESEQDCGYCDPADTASVESAVDAYRQGTLKDSLLREFCREGERSELPWDVVKSLIEMTDDLSFVESAEMFAEVVTILEGETSSDEDLPSAEQCRPRGLYETKRALNRISRGYVSQHRYSWRGKKLEKQTAQRKAHYKLLAQIVKTQDRDEFRRMLDEALDRMEREEVRRWSSAELGKIGDRFLKLSERLYCASPSSASMLAA